MNLPVVDGFKFGQDMPNIDPNVTMYLPAGSRIISTQPHGNSFRAVTSRIDLKLQSGATTSFFIKAVSNEHGKAMVQSEYESMSAIYQVTPDFAPKPIGWGSFATNPNTHYFLCTFANMTGAIPGPEKLSLNLATLHRNSKSPTGKFGFHLSTYSGNVPHYVGWEISWEVFFTKNLTFALNSEIAARGYDPEFDLLVPIIFSKVIPRLLRRLESEGRSVKPSLVHGDLWYANSGVDPGSGNSLIFDACCVYAHNEYEFGQWRPVCNKFGPEYLSAYHSYIPISPPEEDYEGRLDLYRLFNTRIRSLQG